MTRIRASVATGGTAAPLPSKTRSSGSSCEASRAPSRTLRQERSACEPSPCPPAADGRHAGERRGLEMVGGCVPARAGEREQVVERRRRLDELRLGRPAAAHRHDDDPAVAGEQARDVPGHRRLSDPLPQADHRERRRRRPARAAADRSGSRRRRTAARARARAKPTASAPAARAPARRRGRPRDPPRPRRARRPAERRSRRHPAASPSRRRAARRRRRTAAPRAHRARPARSARRRSGRARAGSRRAHLVLDPRRVLLVRLRVGRELDDLLLPVERVATPDVDVRCPRPRRRCNRASLCRAAATRRPSRR